MIKNERQYAITRSQAERLARAVEALAREEQPPERMHPLLRKAQLDGLRSQLHDLRQELAEYEALLSGSFAAPDLRSFIDLPKALIQRRIAARMTQKQLASRLGLKQQQIQHYEATDYAGARLASIMAVIAALEMATAERAAAPPPAARAPAIPSP